MLLKASFRVVVLTSAADYLRKSTHSYYLWMYIYICAYEPPNVIEEFIPISYFFYLSLLHFFYHITCLIQSIIRACRVLLSTSVSIYDKIRDKFSLFIYLFIFLADGKIR